MVVHVERDSNPHLGLSERPALSVELSTRNTWRHLPQKESSQGGPPKSQR